MIEQIDAYIEELRIEMDKLLADTSIPMSTKNAKMKPLVEKKRAVEFAKRALIEIDNTEYEEKCGMGDKR
jgi:hypothetical protein